MARDTPGIGPPDGFDIEALSNQLAAIKERENAARPLAAERPKDPFAYTDMPTGENWLTNPPPRIVDGRRGVDFRLIGELAAVGVRCYTLSDLANALATIPPAIPIFVDWLIHLEERIPGPETPHRASIRTDLFRNLIDPAARGNRNAIEALFARAFTTPPLDPGDMYWAVKALNETASDRDLDRNRMRALFDRVDDDAKWPILEYLSRTRHLDAEQLAVAALDNPNLRVPGIQALTRMRAARMRTLIQRYANDPNRQVRAAVKKAENGFGR
jgi:hypothetical protein